MKDSIEYFRELSKILSHHIDYGKVNQIARLLSDTRQVLVIGNGGSAAAASHFAADLSKTVQSQNVISLDNISAMTAIANDLGYEYVFSEQLKNYPDRDILIAISTSGESKNVINAVRAARDLNINTVALTGFAGGELGRIAGWHINVPSTIIEMVEDAHMAILHSVVRILKSVNNVPM